MGTPKSDQKRPDGLIDGFSATSPTKIFWNSRKRTANGQSLDQVMEESLKEGSKTDDPMGATEKMEDKTPVLSDRRKALFEPLEPTNISNERRLRPSAETLLPPPDFDDASYPRGWLVGKKRKLVNVDVVESMRRIAVQEMNRKDREIDGLNEQLEEDARCLEHLQLQLLQEKSKRADVEREKALLKEQVSMLMSMLQENENDIGMDDEHGPSDDS
ncbi:protein HEADING DATE REPRESSOR 1 isoform X1 [Magnolia sinica]|uniref:protein HEADING DATE REPRESSOR 1 isoform X1 n=1 Tax=Magnolia sinica TaxID=86752 RepID=UPI00265899EB|nr:protein HEADING DATE REPRESSOR 1 isoform X1 [Magnolia sinica]